MGLRFSWCAAAKQSTLSGGQSERERERGGGRKRERERERGGEGERGHKERERQRQADGQKNTEREREGSPEKFEGLEAGARVAREGMPHQLLQQGHRLLVAFKFSLVASRYR